MPARVTRLPRHAFGSGWRSVVATPFFMLKAKENGGTAKRIGIVAGVSVNKKAAKRNFWKRQAREALGGAGVAPGKDLLIIISPKVNAATKKQFREAVVKAAARLN